MLYTRIHTRTHTQGYISIYGFFLLLKGIMSVLLIKCN